MLLERLSTTNETNFLHEVTMSRIFQASFRISRDRNAHKCLLTRSSMRRAQIHILLFRHYMKTTFYPVRAQILWTCQHQWTTLMTVSSICHKQISSHHQEIS